jgi:hypothetical protein
MKVNKLKFPKETKITGRSSTLRGSFVKAIIPILGMNHPEFNDNDYKFGLTILSHTEGGVKCAYCGDKEATDLDHFRAVVKNKFVSRFITDIYNLVPACGTCNQSKSGSDWKDWIIGIAPKNPKNRGVENLEQIIVNLHSFEKWSDSKVRVLADDFLNSKELKDYMDSCENLIKSFEEFQKQADKLKTIAENSLKIGI